MWPEARTSVQIWPASQTPWFQPLRVRPASIPRLDVGRWTLGLPGSSEQLMGVNLGSHVGQARLLWHAQVLLAHKQGVDGRGGGIKNPQKRPGAGFCWSLLAGLCSSRLGSARLCGVMLSSAGLSCWVLLGLAGFCCVLLGSAGFCLFLLCSAVRCCVLLVSAGWALLSSAGLC